MSVQEIIAELPKLEPEELRLVVEKVHELEAGGRPDLSGGPGNRPTRFAIENGADGLPVIRAQGGVITTALVREIEGLAG